MYINFEFPTFPYYIESGLDKFEKGMWHMSRNEITYFDLLIVKQGAIYINEDNKIYDICENNFLILEPGKPHKSYKACTEETIYYWLLFRTTSGFTITEQKPKELRLNNKHYFSVPKFGCIEKTKKIFDYLDDLEKIDSYSNNYNKYTKEIIFHQLMLDISVLPNVFDTQKNSATSYKILEVAEQTNKYIMLHWHEKFNYKKLEKALNFSHPYITRCFKEVYGVTPQDYLTNKRLVEAKYNLRYTDKSIEEIALNMGFNSYTYFWRIFSKEVGTSPTEYRKLHGSK